MNDYRCYVYCLFRPRENQPFYFGITEDLQTRKGEHKRKYGQETYFAVIHSFPTSAQARESETYYIELYALWGRPLLNIAKNPAHRDAPRNFPNSRLWPVYKGNH